MDPNEREIREILEVVEAAGVAGLCLEGRLEIGLQEARRLRPELDDEALRRLVVTVLTETGEG
jgi:hypothetical protein